MKLKEKIALILAVTVLGTAVPAGAAKNTTITSNPVTITTESTTEETTEATTEATTKKVITTEATTDKQETTTKRTETTTKKTETTTETVTKKVESTTETTTKKVEKTTETTTAVQPNRGGHTTPSVIHLTLQVGDTKDLGTYISIDPGKLSWDSNNDDIVSVNQNGIVTAEEYGHTTVYGRGVYDYVFNIQVNDSDTTDTRDITLYEEEEKDLGTYIRHGSPSHYDWSSSDHSIVTVDDDGYVTAKRRDGHAVVKAKNGEYYYQFNIRVRETDGKHPINHNYSDESMPLYMDEGDRVDVEKFLDSDFDSYKWHSEDTDVAYVDNNKNEIVARREGKTEIYANGTRYDYKFVIYVDEDYSIDEITMRVGEDLDYERHIDGKIKDAKAESFKGNILSADKNGEVYAKAKGVGYIIFKSNRGEVYELLVDVKDNPDKHYREIASESTSEATTENSYKHVSFNDINERPWAKEAIENMASKQFIVGRGNGKFAPDDNCTKADFTIVLVKMLGLENMEPSGNFDDVKLSDYFYNYVSIAKNNGLTVGIVNNKFNPKNNITREEIMAMVYNGLKLKGIKMDTDLSILDKYTDTESIDPEYREAVAGLMSIGAVQGTSAVTIDPKSDITRAQMAVLMNNVYNMIK